MFMINTYEKLVELLELCVKHNLRPVDKLLKRVERATGIQKVLFYHGIVLTTLTFLAANYFSALSNYILTCVYPGLMTMEALQTKDDAQCIQWLTFWAVFVYVEIAFSLSSSVLGEIVPLFWLVKPLILIWCYAPIENNGSHFVYDQYLMPTVELIKSNKIDRVTASWIDSLSDTLQLEKPKDRSAVSSAIDLAKTFKALMGGGGGTEPQAAPETDPEVAPTTTTADTGTTSPQSLQQSPAVSPPAQAAPSQDPTSPPEEPTKRSDSDKRQKKAD